MRKHLQEQSDIYGEQHLVNLVNHDGHEKPVKDAFENVFAEVCDSHDTATRHSDFCAATIAEGEVRVL